jgi:hypothetical protein
VADAFLLLPAGLFLERAFVLHDDPLLDQDALILIFAVFQHLELLPILPEMARVQGQGLLRALIVVLKSLVEVGGLVDGTQEHRVHQILPVHNHTPEGTLGILPV